MMMLVQNALTIENASFAMFDGLAIVSLYALTMQSDASFACYLD